jgi:hypothetical protein
MDMDMDMGMAARKTATRNKLRRPRFEMTPKSKMITEFNLQI